jgi:hypothetical protein
MRRVLRVLAALLVLLVVGLSVALLASPYLRRYTFLMYADVYDYDKLPARGVSRSAEPFQFPDAGAGDWIAPLGVTFGGQALPGTEELGRFLSGTGRPRSSQSRRAAPRRALLQGSGATRVQVLLGRKSVVPG